MRSRAKLHGAIGNRVQGEPRLCSTTRFPMKSHTTKCSSAASRTDSIPMGRPTFRSSVSVPAITARLHSIQRQERFFRSEKSHYEVQFCCVANGFNSDGTPNLQVFSERASYHGEIAFDPATGTILRITMEAEMQPGELVSKAAMLIEYGPVEIGGKSYTDRKSTRLNSSHLGISY